MVAIASRLLQGKDLEEDEEYEYIPIQPLDPGVPEDHSTPKMKGGPHMSLSTCQNRNFSSF